MPLSRKLTIIVNGQPRELDPPATVARLLAQLNTPTRGLAIEVNEQIVPRARHAEHLLADGDRLEIVSLVGGG
jgi:sulfur carrier protein